MSQLKPKPEARVVLGIDASTKSIAFCVFEDGKPAHWGKVFLDAETIHETCGEANRKIYGLLRYYEPDFLAIEDAIFVNNRKVVISLAKVFGSIIGVAEALGVSTVSVPPSTWMSYIGNPTRNSKELKAKVRKEYPGKSKTWYNNKLREWRKQRTQAWITKQFDIDITDDDVSDAFGIAHYTVKELVK